MNSTSKEKKDLVEELGLFAQERHKLPPLAARIYSILVLSSNEGYSFDQLMESTQSSKSSVSTNLKLLISLKFVDYYTRTGNRKRFFRSTGSYVTNMLNEHVDSVYKELRIANKVNTFNKNYNPAKFKEKGYVGITFQTYLETQKRNLEDTLEKINAFQNNN
jgi:DNA-binding transcriptional regulator GbsR (MarR family)